MPSAHSRRYWFPAKRYGWGWGPPRTWQGWLVLAVYFALMLGGIPFIHASIGSLAYLAYVGILSVTLIAIGWLRGEPPRWRWGNRGK